MCSNHNIIKSHFSPAFLFQNHQSSPSRRTIERPGARRRPKTPSAIQGSIKEGVDQEQQVQGEIVCHNQTSCCVQMCDPWPTVLAVEQLRKRHGLSVIEQKKKASYSYVAAPEYLACPTTKQKNIKIQVIWNLWPGACGKEKELSPIIWLMTNARPEACDCVSV